jgi:predicted  nucleic acid-binding Zn-ribbon protein
MDDVRLMQELAGLDKREKRLRARAEEVPLLIEETRKKINDAEAEVAKTKNEAEEQKKIMRSLELEIQAMTDKLDKYSKQLLDVKTNKEFQSLRKEMSDVETAISEREDQLLETMDLLDGSTRLVEDTGGKAHEVRVKEGKNLKKLEEELEDTEVQLIEVSEKRNRAIERLSPQLREEYLKIRAHYAGDAIVSVEGGVCTGCYVNIPPNVVGELHAVKNIIRCEQCGRFLYCGDDYE